MSCSAAALTQLSVILAMWSGAALVWWWVVVEPLADQVEVVGEAAGVRLLPAVTAPATVLLALLGATAARYPNSRGGLLFYALCSLLCALLYCAALAWGGVMTSQWLGASPALAVLHARPQLRAALRPLLPLLAPDLEGHFQEESVSVSSCAAWGMVALWPLLQLLGAVLAICARNERHQLRSASSRSNSVYYEQSPTQITKQPLPRAPFDQHALWH